jgi:putative membrane protein
MDQLKRSMSKRAALACVVGLAACGGSQPAQPASPSSQAQMNQSSSEQTGSTMGQQGTSGGESTENQSTDNGSTSTTIGGGQPGTTMGGSTQAGTPSQGGATGTTGAMSTMGGDSMDVSSLNDAQVAAVMQALNTGEIQQAQLAQSKARSPEVKRFAQKMLAAHRDMMTADATLLSRIKITPSDNAISNQLKTDAQNDMSTLQEPTGRDFDRDYIDSQVRAHNRAIELVDRMAMNVQNSELRTNLQNARPKIEQHLRDAERIQQSLAQQGQQSQGTHNKQ